MGRCGLSRVEKTPASASDRTHGEAGCWWFGTTGRPKTRYARLYEGLSGGMKPPASGFATRPAGRAAKLATSNQCAVAISAHYREALALDTGARAHSVTLRWLSLL